MNPWLKVITCSVVLLQSVVLSAQSYRVVVDNSPFRRDGEEIARVAAGTEIYALEKKDGQLLAVEPTSQTQAWIASDLVELIPRAPQQIQSIERLVDRMEAIEKYVNASSATLAELEQTIAWAEELRNARRQASHIGNRDGICGARRLATWCL